MARSSKTTASKSGGGIKARGRPAAKKTAALERKSRRPQKRSIQAERRPAKGRPQRPLRLNPEPCAGGGKARGRTAAKSTSRATKTASKRAERISQTEHGKSASSRSGAKRTRRTENANLGAAVTNPVTEAMALGTEVVAGAIQAGGDIAAATADMAMSAARTAAAVTTGVVPEESQEDEPGSKHERQRGGVRRGS